MKNLSILFIAFLLLQLNTLAQEGWVQQNSGTNSNLNAVHFIDANNGFAVGDNGTFLSSTDSGDSWAVQSIASSNVHLLDVFFTDANNGIVVGYGSLREHWGVILNTTDGGVNWIEQLFGMAMYSVYLIDAYTGWAVGKYPLADYILKTTNSGTNWTPHPSGTTQGVFSVHFANQNTGWVVGYDGTILMTTNGGENWTAQTSGTEADLSSTHFIDNYTGWSVGRWGTILKTIDGGEDWIIQKDRGYRLNSVHFTDPNNGWAVGRMGTILYTTDGGDNWTPQVSGKMIDLSSVHFVDLNTGWIVGTEGTILYTTNGGVSFIEENEIDEIPTDYNLTNNFPNPFNPVTIIKYQIPELSFVTLKVYDVLGKEIATLVNNEKPVGGYEVEFNASSLPSGIYFYRLKAVPTGRQAGSFVETKKMVLMK